MTWIESIHRWRALPYQEQQRRRLANLPHKVARSMAFEGEPVSECMLRGYLDQLTAQRETKRKKVGNKTYRDQRENRCR